MASTYTVNIGIEKPGTGDQSGTWGSTTNTNFDIIDQATNGVATVTLAAAGTSGSPNTLLINNGALSDGRNRFIEFNDGADLGATAYVQLDPNDAEKIVHIRNSLSASRSLILFQGTYNASNDFEVPNGADVLVKFDGGGAGATVTDVNVNLTPTKLTTSDADINGGDIDGTTIGASSAAAITGTTITGTSFVTSGDMTFGDDDKAIFGAGSDLQIYHNGSTSYIYEQGTGDLRIRGSQVRIEDDDGSTIALFKEDAGVELRYDGAVKLESTATGVTVTGTAVATTNTDATNTGNITLDFGANQNFVLTLTGNVTLDNPTTEQVGQSGFIVFIQDGTGGRTVSLGTDYETAGGAGLTLSSTASATDIVPYVVAASGRILLGAPQLAFA